VGILELDRNQTMIRSALLYSALDDAVRNLNYPGHLAVFFDRGTALVGEHCLSDGLYSIGWDESMNPYTVLSTIISCVLEWKRARSGTPPPPGGGFETVTNEGYAWDEGIKAFLAEALSNNPSAPGTGLEPASSGPPAIADAPRVARNVGAALYDLYDTNNDGRDQYTGSVAQIMSVLYRRPVRSLAEFWNFWKADGLPRHYPLLALWNNRVDYDTPPAWTYPSPEPIWVDPGDEARFRLDLDCSDAETPDALLTFDILSLVEATDPVTYRVGGNTLYATMTPANPPGHAFFLVDAHDGIKGTQGLIRIVWTNGAKPPPEEIDDPSAATNPRDEEQGSLALALAGTSVMRPAGRFEFTLPVACDARLSVYDVSGRLIATIAEGFRPAGRHEVTWSGESSGAKPGIYLVELRALNQRRTLRTALVR